MMLKVGVTGGIGSGKTLICRVFATLGVPVYNADSEAGRIMNEDEKVMDEIRKAFGKGVFTEGKPDRIALAGIVFADGKALMRLNSIIHPAVQEDFTAWLERHTGEPYIIKEAAILFESGTYRSLDTVILVTAPEGLRLQRVMDRDRTGEEEVRQRMSRQWPDGKKAALAGMVINNDNKQPVLPLILQLHSELSRGYMREELKLN